MLKTVPAFDRIGEENAFAVLARANALAAQGRDIINLGIGQPDFRTPDFIVEAAIKALRDGHHGYTPANGAMDTRSPLDVATVHDVNRWQPLTYVDGSGTLVTPSFAGAQWQHVRPFATASDDRLRSPTGPARRIPGV